MYLHASTYVLPVPYPVNERSQFLNIIPLTKRHEPLYLLALKAKVGAHTFCTMRPYRLLLNYYYYIRVIEFNTCSYSSIIIFASRLLLAKST